MEDGRNPGGGENQRDLLGFPEAVREQDRRLLFVERAAAGGDQTRFELLGPRKTEHRKAERRLGHEDLRGRRRRGDRRARETAFEVAGEKERPTVALEEELRGPEDVPRRMELERHAVPLQAFSVSDLARSPGPFRVPAAVERDRLGRRPELFMAGRGMIAVRMGDDRAGGGARRVDRRFEGRAIQAFRTGLEERREQFVRRQGGPPSAAAGGRRAGE